MDQEWIDANQAGFWVSGRGRNRRLCCVRKQDGSGRLPWLGKLPRLRIFRLRSGCSGDVREVGKGGNACDL